MGHNLYAGTGWNENKIKNVQHKNWSTSVFVSLVVVVTTKTENVWEQKPKGGKRIIENGFER